MSKRARVTRIAVAWLLLANTGAAASAADLPYAESFDGPNGSAWPAPWLPGTTHVTVWDLQGDRARLSGDTQFVARMLLPGYEALDVEAAVTVEFEDVHAQGFGFYVRQNGGTLREYTPHGQGYAMFLKGAWGWPEDLGLWREIDGVETQFAWGNDPIASGLENGTRYRLRFRVTQDAPGTTLLRAKVWPEAEAEPAAWTIEAFDSQAELQGTLGSFAIDIYNHVGVGHIFVDDLAIAPYPGATSAPAPAPRGRVALSLPRPHPVVGPSRVDVAAPEGARVTLSLHDASGRRVARLFDEPLGAVAASIAFEPLDGNGRSLAAGVYFLRLDAAGERVAQRIVVTR
jgi:hypothetical protein